MDDISNGIDLSQTNHHHHHHDHHQELLLQQQQQFDSNNKGVQQSHQHQQAQQQQKNPIESDDDLFVSLKFHIDSQQKLNQLNQCRIRSFERFRKYCQQLTSFVETGDASKFNLEQFQNEYNKFDKNYRYFKKRIRNLKKQTKSSISIQRCHTNPYETLYDLFAKIEKLERGYNDDSYNDNNESKKHDDHYLSSDQIYPEISINVIESQSLNNNHQHRATTQDKSVQCNLANILDGGRAKASKPPPPPPEQPPVKKRVGRPRKIVIVDENFYDERTPSEHLSSDSDSDASFQAKRKPKKIVRGRPKKQTTKTKKAALKAAKTAKTAKAKAKAEAKKLLVKQENSLDSDSSIPPKIKLKRGRKPKPPTELFCHVEGCQYSTNASWILKLHQRAHSTERPFKCEKCEAAFKYKGDLKVHQNTHEKRRFSCTFEGCTVSYATRKGILKHYKIFHTKEAPLLRCNWVGCDYTTYNAPCLKVHQAVHTDQRPYKCPDCEMAFKSASNLWSHKLTHQNERRFKCDFEGCDYASYNKELLQNHQFVHNVDRPFNCVWPECGMSFKSPSGLWKHKTMHENQRRYRCKWEGCEYAANLSGSLRVHVETVHEKKKKIRNRRKKRPAPTLPETNNSWEMKTNSAIDAVAGEMINCFGGQSINHTGHGHIQHNQQPPLIRAPCCKT